MPNTPARLAKCFLAVFPELKPEDVTLAAPTTVTDWDSVASVNLLTVIEEEFGVQVDFTDVLETLSYEQLCVYLENRIDGHNEQGPSAHHV